MAIPSLLGGHKGGGLKSMGFAQYTTTTPAFSLATTPNTGVALPAGCSIALLQAESVGIRARGDATNPTSAIGMLMTINEGLLLQGDLASWRFIQSAGGSILNVLYFG